MKLVSVIQDGARLAGVLEGEDVYVTTIPGLEAAIARGSDLRKSPGEWRKLGDVVLDVPLRPGAVLGTGSNYRDHLDERVPASEGTNAPRRELEFFVKTGLTVAGLRDPLRLAPSIGAKIDQETELGLVIGPGCPRGLTEERAMAYVYGYVVVNDLTARDKQVRFTPDGHSFMVLGGSKNFDGATRLASHMVTADEIGDVNNLDIRTYLNGEMTQNNNTRHLINSLARIVAFFSEALTLQPGTLIITGTPGGTGWGQDAELRGKGYVPPGCVRARYLRPGDEVRSVVQHVGELSFRVE